jgi:hypothetical protein
MKLKLSHPLWTHVAPFITLTIYIIIFIYISAYDIIATKVPLHFNFKGEPNSYGSPWLTFGLTIGLSVFFILLSIILDNLWAKQENKKSFNWLSLLDDITVGMLVGVNTGYLAYLCQGTTLFSFPWNYLLAFGGGSVLLAIILEILRPYRANPEKITTQQDNAFKDSLTRYLGKISSFVYWDYQNPFYVSILTTGLPLVLLISSVLTWFSEPLVSLLLGIIGILLLIPYGGQRTMVTRDAVTIRWGILGFKVLKVNTMDIVSIQVHDFAPLRDFGGYGIRFNREMKASYLNGTQGVKLTTTSGKKYLIGSDHADHLATVIKAVSLASGKNEG